jgi:hypothetical protein
MRRSTILLTSEAALVAAMLQRMGWVDWLATIHTTLCIGLVLGIALVFLLLGAGLFIGLPVLILIGISKAVVWLFQPATFGDAA